MIDFFIYKPSGEIICSGRCPQNILEMQGAHLEGVTVQEGVASWETDYILDGNVTPKGVPPSADHIFDYTTKQWVDPRTLDDHKSAKWKEIKCQRDVAEFATFTYNNMEFDGDLDAQRRLAAYISVSKSSIAAGQPFEAEFTLANNTNVTLTAQDFVGIELAKVQAVAATFNHASALRAQIDAATTVQEVEAITW